MDTILVIFLVLLAGYGLGSIKILGIQLGTSGVLLVALVAGHFGFEVPSLLRNFGLVCFVASVGYIAGPNFFRSFKSKAVSFIILGFSIVIVSGLICVLSILFFDVPTDLAVGLFTGAITSTPGLAAAIEATQSEMASIGYGIAYPFGVIGVVLFVQMLPRILRVDLAGEIKQMSSENNRTLPRKHIDGNWKTDIHGIFPLALAICVGLLIAMLEIPLPGGASFSFGIAGGPLLSGLVFGHFNRIGIISLMIPIKNLEIIREIGLALFLLGAGLTAGKGFIDVLVSQGFYLFIVGIFITLVPMATGYFLAVKVFKLNVTTALGAICGGMTSTPALGALIVTTGSNVVVTAYAVTYPIALVCVVLTSQLIAVFL